MDDPLHARQGLEGLRPKKPMSVGNQTDRNVVCRRVRHRKSNTAG